MFEQPRSRYECPKCKYITTVTNNEKIMRNGVAICEGCRSKFMI